MSSQDLPGQDAAHPGGRCPARDVVTDCDAVQVEVVDDADGFARVVDELAVQQVQPGVQQPTGRVGCVGKVVAGVCHWPAPVTIINGMAASDAARMITRYTDASTLVARPLTCSPM